jgi:integrase
MGRPRTTSPAWLPPRCYPHGSRIRFIPKGGKPVDLGPRDNPGECMRRYGEIAGDHTAPRLMGEVLDKYLLEVVPTLSPGSQATYRLYLDKLKQGFGHMHPDEILTTDLYDYHNARCAPVRANREITVLGKIYRYAIKWRAATPGRNPCQGFIYAEETARERKVSNRERTLFAKRHCPPWLRGYMLLKYLAGRRAGEMLKLSTFSEKPDGIAFQILKKRKLRTLTITWTPRLRVVWAWLKALPRPEKCAMIFWSQRGKTRGEGMSASGLKSAWQRAQKDWIAAGNHAFWEHDIRGAAGSDAESDARAQELLDHESVSTTRKSYRRNVVKKVRPLR